MAVDFTQAPSSYTPAPTVGTPSFGQSGSNVSALQTSINAKLAGTPGFTPIKVDGLYGPETYAAAQKASNLITTSAPASTTYNNNVSALQRAEQNLGINTPSTPITNPQNNPTNSNGSSSTGDTSGGTGAGGGNSQTSNGGSNTDPTASNDPVVQQLESLKTTNDAATNALIQSTQSSYTDQINQLNKTFENYKSGLQLLGIQTGEAEATPDLLMGHILQATTDQLSKVQSLKAAEAKAVLDGQVAIQTNDTKTVQEVATRLQAIKTAQTQAIKDTYDIVSGQTNTAKVEAHDIYDVLQTLDNTTQDVPGLGGGMVTAQEALIQQAAQQFNIPVNDLVTALGDEKNTRDTTAQKVDPVLTPTEAKTLGVPYGTTKSQASKMGITPVGTASKSGTAATPYKFTNTAKGQLANTGLTPADISGLQADIAKYGVQTVLKNPKNTLTDEQKALIEKIVVAKKASTTIDTSTPLFGGTTTASQ